VLKELKLHEYKDFEAFFITEINIELMFNILKSILKIMTDMLLNSASHNFEKTAKFVSNTSKFI